MQLHSCRQTTTLIEAESQYNGRCCQHDLAEPSIAFLRVQISTAEIREMEKEEAWEPTGRVPVLDEDILEV